MAASLEPKMTNEEDKVGRVWGLFNLKKYKVLYRFQTLTQSEQTYCVKRHVLNNLSVTSPDCVSLHTTTHTH